MVAPTFRLEVERRTAAGFEAVGEEALDDERGAGCGTPAWSRAATNGRELWWEVELADARFVGTAGELRVRARWAGEPRRGRAAPEPWLASEWISVSVAPHAGNREAVAAHREEWAVLTAPWPHCDRFLYLGAVRLPDRRPDARIAKAVAWSKAAALSAGLRLRGEVLAASRALAEGQWQTAVGFGDAAARAARWRQAQRDLAAIDTRGWDGPTGGIAADVLRMRMEHTDDWDELEELRNLLRQRHPHAVLPDGAGFPRRR
jgi:hypothetical protein